MKLRNNNIREYKESKHLTCVVSRKPFRQSPQSIQQGRPTPLTEHNQITLRFWYSNPPLAMTQQVIKIKDQTLRMETETNLVEPHLLGRWDVEGNGLMEFQGDNLLGRGEEIEGIQGAVAMSWNSWRQWKRNKNCGFSSSKEGGKNLGRSFQFWLMNVTFKFSFG